MVFLFGSTQHSKAIGNNTSTGVERQYYSRHVAAHSGDFRGGG